jgi:hypothetical protein
MPDIDQKNGIDMANIASINGQDIAGGAYDPLTDTGTFTETVPTTGMIYYGGLQLNGRPYDDSSSTSDFIKGPKVLFASDKDGIFGITQQNTKNWTKFESSSNTLAGIDTDGKLWMCGNSTSRTHQSSNLQTLTQVTGVGDSDTGWTDVSVGSGHVLAINSGKLYGLGRNNDREIGITSGNVYNTLTQVGSDTDWQLVSCGRAYSIAVKGVSGSMALYSTGSNASGQTGQGTTSGDTVGFTEALASDSDDYTFITASYDASMAIKGGKVYMCGNGTNEKQGNNSTSNVTSFTQTGKTDASTFGTNWVGGAFGNRTHSHLINSSGELWFAGEGNYRNRGDGSTTDAKDGYHVKVSGVGDDWTLICKNTWAGSTSGQNLPSAGINNGRLYVWGYNSVNAAQLGTATRQTGPNATATLVNNTNTCSYAVIDDSTGVSGGVAQSNRGLLAAFNT